jgi:hypothetical protein
MSYIELHKSIKSIDLELDILIKKYRSITNSVKKTTMKRIMSRKNDIFDIIDKKDLFDVIDKII